MISVIVPIYNAEPYLEHCLNSIINQTYNNLEIILINDGSTDNSSMICDDFSELDKRINVIHKSNEGPSHTRNLGINISNGSYIAFVDADDWIESRYLELMYKNIKEKGSDLCICGYRHFYNDSDYNDYLPRDFFTLENSKIDLKEYRKLMLSEAPLLIGSPCLKLIKKELLINNNIIFPTNIPRNVDLVFNLRLLPYLKKITYIDDVLYTYRYVESSVYRKYRSNLLEIYKFINSERIKTISMIDSYTTDFKKVSYKAFVENCITIIATETRSDSSKKLDDKLQIISDSIDTMQQIPNYKKIYQQLDIKGISPKIVGPLSIYFGKYLTTLITFLLMKIREILKI